MAMTTSGRTQFIFEKSRKKGINPPLSHFQYDLHVSAKTQFSHLEQWEKIARSMAFAVVNQDVLIEPYDRIIGRTYHLNRRPVECPDPDLDYISAPYHKLCAEIDGYEELCACQLSGSTGVGHITWFWDKILTLGISGMQDLYNRAKETARDKKAEEFYEGVLIMLEALTVWNQRHVSMLEEQGMHDMAEICKRVPLYPAQSFHEAVQSFFMQYIVVMSENPFGGNGPGRLDYYLWPYLERDLQNRSCTMEQARELIDELFIRIDERIHGVDTWVEAIVVGGTHSNGTSAANPLSYMMIQSIMELNITHPSVYVRLPENPPEDLIKLCAEYLRSGTNRAQILNDAAIIKALNQNGVFTRDAVEYACGGCMEIGIQGMTSDFLYNGWQNIPKLVELFVTGGECLVTKKKLTAVKAKGLECYQDFESFYHDFIAEAARILNVFFKAQDIYSERAEAARPSYLISSMIDDCLVRGRNMHGGGAKYHDYGSTPLGLPNAADSLLAIKKAVFDDKICTAHELVEALKANFKGHEQLRLKLRALPKYGRQHEEADEMARRLMTDICAIFSSYRNRWGGNGKPVILTFIWAPEAGAMLGATADGNLAGKPVAQGITPQSTSMTLGITAAMNSCLSMPFPLFGGGASTMWDLDTAWANEEIIRALLMTFVKNGGQIFQGNTTDVKSLLEAQKNPDEYGHLIVRVGGYSARFVNLSQELQNDIITRIRHAQ